MARTKRANGAGTVYIKNGSYYGRWVTLEGGRTNRKLGRDEMDAEMRFSGLDVRRAPA